MRRFSRSIVCALTLVAIGVCASGWSGSPPDAGGADAVDEAVAVQYARACLELAETELAKEVFVARKLPRVVNKTRLNWLRANVEICREQLRAAKQQRVDSTTPVQLAFCEATARSAAEDYRAALESGERNPDVLRELVLESLRLRAKTAHLRLKMWQGGDSVSSTVDQMQWQIDRLTEEIVELNDRLARVETRVEKGMTK